MVFDSEGPSKPRRSIREHRRALLQYWIELAEGSGFLTVNIDPQTSNLKSMDFHPVLQGYKSVLLCCSSGTRACERSLWSPELALGMISQVLLSLESPGDEALPADPGSILTII